MLGYHSRILSNTYSHRNVGSKTVEALSIIPRFEQSHIVPPNVQGGVGHAQTFATDKVSHIVNSEIRNDRSCAHWRLEAKPREA